MAKYRITGPDGQAYEITAPDEASEQDVLAYAQQNYQQAQAAPKTTAPVETYDPTEGMSFAEQWAARFGGNYVDLYRGAKQAATEAVGQPLNAVGGVLEAIGVKGAREHAGAGAVNRSLAMQQEVIDEDARLQAPLKRTAGGMAGDVTASISQLVTPAVLARGQGPIRNAIRPAFLPTTTRGNVIQGGLYGGLQPVETGGSRARNAAIGGGVAGAATLLPKAVGGTVRGTRSAVEPFTKAGAEKRAVQSIQQEASNPQALLISSPSRIPGVTRTLFDESQDAGVARLETKSRGTAGGWVEFDKANNAARVAAITAFAGDDAALRGAVKDRNSATTRLREIAMQDRGVDVAPVKGKLAAMLAASQTRPSKLAALLDVDNALSKADDSVASLYGVRQYIDDLMSGKAGSDKGYARAAKADLVKIKGELDTQITAVSPDFRAYLDEFISRSKPIDQMKVGQRLLKDGSGRNLDPDTGVYTLMPGQYGGRVKSIDRLAESATGFKGATAERTLGPANMGVVRAVDDDLARSSRRMLNGSGGGSHTDAQGELAERMAKRGLSKLPMGLGDVFDALQSAGQKRVASALSEVLRNPQQYREIAAQLSQADRRALEQTMIKITGAGGSMALPVAQ
jgi:hypothetical protein